MVNAFLTDTVDRQFNHSINPVNLITNRYGSFFMVKVNCTAGGSCAIYRLLEFDKSGRFITEKKLGQLAAEENSATYFSYGILSDTTLRVTSEEYENDSATDRTSAIVELRL